MELEHAQEMAYVDKRAFETLESAKSIDIWAPYSYHNSIEFDPHAKYRPEELVYISKSSVSSVPIKEQTNMPAAALKKPQVNNLVNRNNSLRISAGHSKYSSFKMPSCATINLPAQVHDSMDLPNALNQNEAALFESANGLNAGDIFLCSPQNKFWENTQETDGPSIGIDVFGKSARSSISPRIVPDVLSTFPAISPDTVSQPGTKQLGPNKIIDENVQIQTDWKGWVPEVSPETDGPSFGIDVFGKSARSSLSPRIVPDVLSAFPAISPDTVNQPGTKQLEPNKIIDENVQIQTDWKGWVPEVPPETDGPSIGIDAFGKSARSSISPRIVPDVLSTFPAISPDTVNQPGTKQLGPNKIIDENVQIQTDWKGWVPEVSPETDGPSFGIDVFGKSARSSLSPRIVPDVLSAFPAISPDTVNQPGTKQLEPNKIIDENVQIQTDWKGWVPEVPPETDGPSIGIDAFGKSARSSISPRIVPDVLSTFPAISPDTVNQPGTKQLGPNKIIDENVQIQTDWRGWMPEVLPETDGPSFGIGVYGKSARSSISPRIVPDVLPTFSAISPDTVNQPSTKQLGPRRRLIEIDHDLIKTISISPDNQATPKGEAIQVDFKTDNDKFHDVSLQIPQESLSNFSQSLVNIIASVLIPTPEIYEKLGQLDLPKSTSKLEPIQISKSQPNHVQRNLSLNLEEILSQDLDIPILSNNSKLFDGFAGIEASKTDSSKVIDFDEAPSISIDSSLKDNPELRDFLIDGFDKILKFIQFFFATNENQSKSKEKSTESKIPTQPLIVKVSHSMNALNMDLPNTCSVSQPSSRINYGTETRLIHGVNKPNNIDPLVTDLMVTMDSTTWELSVVPRAKYRSTVEGNIYEFPFKIEFESQTDEIENNSTSFRHTFQINKLDTSFRHTFKIENLLT